MSSSFFYKDQRLWVSNQRFSTLIAFALEVGSQLAKSAPEMESVKQFQLAQDRGERFIGCDFDLAEKFSAGEAKQFWLRVFDEVAMRIFKRQIGNHEVESWQPRAICDAVTISRMLTAAARDDAPSRKG
jgi:hypothetical protein